MELKCALESSNFHHRVFKMLSGRMFVLVSVDLCLVWPTFILLGLRVPILV